MTLLPVRPAAGAPAASLVCVGLVLCCLLGCSERERESSAPPPARPVKLFVVEGGVDDAVRRFPGRVDATQRAELSFRVPGQVQEILVKEGDLVAAGQVLARLDPTDYEIALEERQAVYDSMQRNFSRARELIDDGNISRLEFDRMEADYRTASAALAQAEKNLEYTVLSSPFRGRIARRLVEKFEEVLARQTVFSLQNIERLDVIIDVPESVVRSVRGSVRMDDSLNTGMSVLPIRAYAQFEGRPGERFTLTPKEVATKADEQTRTFRATFTMDAPTTFSVLPGMTATVVLDLSALVDYESVRWVPVRAVQGDSTLQSRVWVLDDATMTVVARAVTVGRMSGDMIEIVGGLEGGEEIVAVGAPYLAEGMRVTRMPVLEQARPRTDDPS